MSQTSDFFLDIWLLLKLVINQEELEEVAYISKFIWQRRNELVFQKGFTHPNALIFKAKYELHCYKNSIETHNRLDTTLSLNTTGVKWQKPSTDISKVNWEATSDQRKQKLGLRFIIQNFEGLVVGSPSYKKLY